MFLENLIKSLPKKYRKIPVNGISFNSKKTKKKIFFLLLEVKKHQVLDL